MTSFLRRSVSPCVVYTTKSETLRSHSLCLADIKADCFTIVSSAQERPASALSATPTSNTTLKHNADRQWLYCSYCGQRVQDRRDVHRRRSPPGLHGQPLRESPDVLVEQRHPDLLQHQRPHWHASIRRHHRCNDPQAHLR
ncbi:hypothetical protein CERSUDRAFT_115120 [Gelatoporia subvermispora B]|uniref:Uncharacterized protein n=1 Tax=Ceriporiopsis subvermispora (strain B) TaxID=914234 RepID=M2PIY7_CERS8|nr:hypothetical protein CERSUDRAFT_115120 [Gelatoporia subvermispora B]